MESLPAELKRPLVDLLLSLADDKFLLGHRNADWTGLAPILEEDIAFSALAQDDLAHAAALYELVASLTGGDANRVAYGRRPEEYRCAHLVELHDEFNWGVAIVRQFLCDHFDFLRLARLAGSAWRPLAELSSRMLAEERLGIGHADQWVVRLGRGTAESHARVQAAIDHLAPLALELFEPTEGLESIESAGVYPPLSPDMFDQWSEAVENVIEEATLHVELHRPARFATSGRRGRRSAEFAALHDELTEVYRLEPDAAW
jgi:ring-1,2-phenylacetyl-CoA epoxidase subunit PaaC